MVNYSQSLAGDSVPPRQAERFFESLLSRSQTISSTRADLEEEILQLSRKIDLLSSCEPKKQGQTNGEVTVVIMAKKATDIELRLTYRMSSSILGLPKMLSFFSNCCDPRQLSGTRHGRRHTNYTPLRKPAFPHHRYPCIIVPASRSVQAKTGQMSRSHSVLPIWTYPTRPFLSSVPRRSDPPNPMRLGSSAVSMPAGPCRHNSKSHI